MYFSFIHKINIHYGITDKDKGTRLTAVFK